MPKKNGLSQKRSFLEDEKESTKHRSSVSYKSGEENRKITEIVV